MANMTRLDCHKKVVAALCTAMMDSLSDASEETPLSECGGFDARNQYMLACFVINLECFFKTRIPDDDGQDWRTIRDVVDYMLKAH